jgi:hypothetical protein
VEAINFCESIHGQNPDESGSGFINTGGEVLGLVSGQNSGLEYMVMEFLHYGELFDYIE